ncbi:MAG: Glycosyltransferase [Candidatus Woesebacteria bacterium GW2011_GWA1_39_21]|uniref:Glycosyltransferase n=1 Tax=Candidatus Woesebacteria bacterium GW2011_GWA1_39_21 TaxID=1618550 RepID=A0A0G0N7S4_9BACT|nr:MAG: Glycosyltransferase [Candidatus Woesebacteria bacterium GW2011_GWA1_39_21]
MKIAVFHNLPVGGAKRTLFEQLSYLIKRHDVDLYEYNSTDETLWNLKDLVANVFSYTFEIKLNKSGIINRLIADHKNFFFLNSLNRKIASDIDHKKYDLVLVHADRYTQAPFILRHLKTPSLYFCQEYLRLAYEKEVSFGEKLTGLNYLYEKITRLIRKNIDKENIESADFVVCNSNFTKKNGNRVYRLKKTAVDHLGVDVKKFHKYVVKRKNYLLFIGEKNFVNGYQLIKSISSKTKCEIKIYGYHQGALRETDDLKLAKIYSEAFLTLCVSYKEPFGLAALESMACATPVLAVDEGGYRETLVNEVSGYLLKRDADLFAKKIKELQNNRKLYEKMSSAAVKLVKAKWTWQVHGKKLEEYMNKLISTNKHE